jgi:hypothetical protein
MIVVFGSLVLLASAADSTDDWHTETRLTDAPCNVERLPMAEFDNVFFRAHIDRPFVLVGAADRQSAIQAATQRAALLASLGDHVVTLSSSNTFSYVKRKVPLRHYVDEMRDDHGSHLSNETFYLFGNTDAVVWAPLLDLYVLPPLANQHERVALSFGVGPDASGVQVHVHGPVWAETLFGRKRWFLFAPATTPRFDPDARSVSWIDDVEQREALGALDCTLGPGEILWIPNMWWHATLNYGETVFVSAFV